MELVAQLFGIFGMGMNILSFQAKKQRTLIFMQFFGSLFFFVNFLMLGAYTGAFLNLIAVGRALVYGNKEKFKHLGWMNLLFYVLYGISYLCSFLVFRKPVTFWNLLVEILPVFAMVLTTISFSKTSAATVRKYALGSSPSWLVYNCVNVSVGGILCEIFSLVSVVTAMIRLDHKKKSE